MCGRRWGKSLISQVISIESGLKKEEVAYITPTYLLATHFFDEIIKQLPKEVYSSNRQEMTIRFVTGGYTQFFTGERLDNLRGRKFHKVIVDEASYIPDLENGWTKSIRPTLTDYKGRAYFLSTPKGRNFFYSLYLKGQNGEQGWSSYKFPTSDNPYLDRGEIEDSERQLPRPVFEQEYLANPMENAANPFGIQHIKMCTYPLSTEPVHCYGIDLAKSTDWTVIIGMDKTGNVCYLDRFQKDWRQTRQMIEALPGIQNTPAYIDSTGVGDPIVEELQRSFSNVKGIKFNSTSKQQMMEGLAANIQQKKISFPEGVITNELEIFEYQYTPYGVKYGAPSGYHDDTVCALALCNKAWMENNTAGSYSLSF